MMEGPGADSEEKHEPVSDIETAVVVVGLKALDPEWPIREAHRNFVISLLTRYRLPNVYPFKYSPTGGVLPPYGPDLIELFPPAAVYVDRILKGGRPADLPVQAPTK